MLKIFLGIVLHDAQALKIYADSTVASYYWASCTFMQALPHLVYTHKLICIPACCGVTYVTVNVITVKRGRGSASKKFTFMGTNAPLDARSKALRTCPLSNLQIQHQLYTSTAYKVRLGTV